MNLHKRTLAALFAAALTFSTAPAALAQEDTGTDNQVTASIPAIPEKVELQIHKLKGMESAERSDGLEKTADGDPVNGVKFTVSKVKGIDLTTDAGWKALAGLTPEGVKTAPGLEDGTEITTVGGVATGSFAPGLYLVEEEASPKDNEGNPLVKSAPFLITLPMTNPDNRSEWLSTVHVYPKNQATEKPVKKIETETPVNVGDKITYTIDSVIPELPEGKSLTGFNVLDRLPAELTEGKVTKVQLGGADFTDFTVESKGNALMVKVTDLTKLTSGATLTVTIEATVSKTPEGTLDNESFVIPNDPGSDYDIENGEVPNPSNKVKSMFGKVNITKQGETEGEKLADATFQLFRCDADNKTVDGPITVNNQADFTTSADEATKGTVTIDGIHLGNVETNAEGTDTYTDVWANNGTNFCLVETVAPEGYELLAEPVKIELTADDNATAPIAVDAAVKNVKTNGGFNLPMTGGMGTWITLIAGLLGLAFAAFYFFAPRRNKN